MSNLDDIFDLPEGAKQYMDNEEKPQPIEKKQRKKPELSEEKKIAMLERLRAGREKRQENLKAKKEPKEEKKEQPKEVISNNEEKERLSFINMMAGKAKPNQTEKFERPKKKIQSDLSVEEKPKIEVKKEEPKKEPIKPLISSAPPPASVAVVKTPIIIRTFKKPIWA